MLSGTGLSVSNLLDTSREAVVSNKDMENFGIPHLTHSQAILVLLDLL